MENKPELPKIKKASEVGETPFQFIEKTESILQGWDNKIRKTIYLFKTDTGSWGYFDNDSNQVVAVTQWNKKSAWIEGHWVKMSLYHRVHLLFTQPISYSAWDSVNRKRISATTQEAIVIITDTAYKSLLEQLNGRDANSLFKFSYITRKIKGRNVTYIDKIIWVPSA